jgi:hypothetical protein
MKNVSRSNLSTYLQFSLNFKFEFFLFINVFQRQTHPLRTSHLEFIKPIKLFLINKKIKLIFSLKNYEYIY